MLSKTLLIAASTLISHGSFAESSNEKWVRYGVQVIENRMESDKPIPSYVLDQAKCIASMKVVKAGLIWGGKGSTGMVSCKTPADEWSAPSFFTVGGVNFGLQIGIQWFESVLVFIANDSKQILERASAKIGVDLSWAAGPEGEGSGSGELPDAHVLSYSRSRGLYAGATVEGLVLSHARKRNREVYGTMTPREILNSRGSEAPAIVTPFVEVLDQYFLSLTGRK